MYTNHEKYTRDWDKTPNDFLFLRLRKKRSSQGQQTLLTNHCYHFISTERTILIKLSNFCDLLYFRDRRIDFKLCEHYQEKRSWVHISHATESEYVAAIFQSRVNGH